MVTIDAMKMTTTCSEMTGILFEIIIIAATDPSKVKSWNVLETVVSLLKPSSQTVRWMTFCTLDLRLLGLFVQSFMSLFTGWAAPLAVHSDRCWYAVFIRYLHKL